MNPESLVRDADPLIAKVGAAFYFAPETLATGKALGLDGLRFYFLGRGGVLGDVEAAVVESAFGYFAPGMVAKMWNTGRERTVLSPREVGRRYVECSREFGRAHFAGTPDLADYCSAAEKAVGAAQPAALALFAGLAAEALPDDLPARAMQLTTVLRELRGSLHLVAVVASGVEPMVAHCYRRPDDFVTFGYDETDRPSLGEDVSAAMGQADALTDRLMGRIYSTLDDGDRAALDAGIRSLAGAAGPLH